MPLHCRLLCAALCALIPGAASAANADASAVALAAGEVHTCAVTSAGGVKCWGGNAHGQLGDGTTVDRATPTDVVGMSSGVSAVAAGAQHTCILTTGGGMKCWGANWGGQLGDGTKTDRATPTDVTGLSGGVAAVVAGEGHTCVLTTTGGMKCWGANWNGQLGDGTTTERVTPGDVGGLASGVAAVAAGLEYTCALNAAGGVMCWGTNWAGQLGDGTGTNRSTPASVSGLASGVVGIDAGGDHTCVVVAGGEVKCWGLNEDGQLGDGTVVSRQTPVSVSGLGGVTNVIAGRHFTCARTAGGPKCWGANDFGQIGGGTAHPQPTPVAVSSLAGGVRAMTAGSIHACALTAGGGVRCWGGNYSGQLGTGSSAQSATPVAVAGLTALATQVAAGSNHTCALTATGGVECWGRNAEGQGGNGTTMLGAVPAEVSGLTTGVASVTAGADHSCAITASGGVRCWGDNSAGQVGDGSLVQRSTPVDVSGLATNVVMISAGGANTCAVTRAGAAKCWGDNWAGQLGDGTTTKRLTPVDVLGLTSGVSAVAVGGVNTCALTAAGGVKCWGLNNGGVLVLPCQFLS